METKFVRVHGGQVRESFLVKEASIALSKGSNAANQYEIKEFLFLPPGV